MMPSNWNRLSAVRVSDRAAKSTRILDCSRTQRMMSPAPRSPTVCWAMHQSSSPAAIGRSAPSTSTAVTTRPCPSTAADGVITNDCDGSRLAFMSSIDAAPIPSSKPSESRTVQGVAELSPFASKATAKAGQPYKSPKSSDGNARPGPPNTIG